MRARSRYSFGGAMALIVLGVLALYAGPRTLVVLVPAAILACYLAAKPGPSRGAELTQGRK